MEAEVREGVVSEERNKPFPLRKNCIFKCTISDTLKSFFKNL